MLIKLLGKSIMCLLIFNELITARFKRSPFKEEFGVEKHSNIYYKFYTLFTFFPVTIMNFLNPYKILPAWKDSGNTYERKADSIIRYVKFR